VPLVDFTTLYEEHAPTVLRFAYWLSGDRSLAEDITSETFVRVWTARERVDLKTVTGYLLTIARHLYLQGITRSRRATELAGEVEDPRPDPHMCAEERAELDAVLADLQALPETDRAALLMRANENLPYTEIAAALGITVTNAKVKVHRARLKLAQQRLRRGGTHR
jgi:RNA polymerase sigma-70 factor (ECF subfamily)